jgi:hypothetical protein
LLSPTRPDQSQTGKTNQYEHQQQSLRDRSDHPNPHSLLSEIKGPFFGCGAPAGGSPALMRSIGNAEDVEQGAETLCKGSICAPMCWVCHSLSYCFPRETDYRKCSANFMAEITAPWRFLSASARTFRQQTPWTRHRAALLAVGRQRRCQLRRESDGGRAIAIRADVSRPAEVGQLLAAALQRFGRLDIAVANAEPDEPSHAAGRLLDRHDQGRRALRIDQQS